MVAAPRIARAARSFDVVLSFSLSMHLETAIAGRLARRPVVIEVVDIVRPGLGRQVLRAASRLASTTVVNSVATAGNLDGDAHRARVIHPGVDLDRFRPGPCDDEVRASLGGRPGRPLVGIVGRVDPGKGIEVLLDAMAATDGPIHDAGLVVVGDVGVGGDDYVDGLRSRARALGDRVTFAGRRSDVPAVLRCLDVLVNASDAEPFGRSVLEAQASGIAVVGTAAGGIPEFVAHEATGLLVPPADPPALRHALERLLGDAELRGRLGAAGRAQAEQRFDLRLRYDLAADTYRRLVADLPRVDRRRDGRAGRPPVPCSAMTDRPVDPPCAQTSDARPVDVAVAPRPDRAGPAGAGRSSPACSAWVGVRRGGVGLRPGWRSAADPRAGRCAGGRRRLGERRAGGRSDAAVRWVGTFDGDPGDDPVGVQLGREATEAVAEVPGVARHGRVLDVAFNPDELGDRGAAAARIGMNRLAPSR